MNGITANQAIKKIDTILDMFMEAERQGVHTQEKGVVNVDFKELLILFGLMARRWHSKVHLYMPGEYGTEGMVIVFSPAIGCTIWIESTPCVSMRWKIHQLTGDQSIIHQN